MESCLNLKKEELSLICIKIAIICVIWEKCLENFITAVRKVIIAYEKEHRGWGKKAKTSKKGAKDTIEF